MMVVKPNLIDDGDIFGLSVVPPYVCSGLENQRVLSHCIFQKNFYASPHKEQREKEQWKNDSDNEENRQAYYWILF